MAHPSCEGENFRAGAIPTCKMEPELDYDLTSANAQRAPKMGPKGRRELERHSRVTSEGPEPSLPSPGVSADVPCGARLAVSRISEMGKGKQTCSVPVPQTLEGLVFRHRSSVSET